MHIAISQTFLVVINVVNILKRCEKSLILKGLLKLSNFVIVNKKNKCCILIFNKPILGNSDFILFGKNFNSLL